MPSLPRHFTVKPSQGGHLITALSTENVGEANYRKKINWRRVEKDAEALREGDVLLDNALNSVDPITALAEVVRPNGEKSIIACTATTVYRYDAVNLLWDEIGTGYDATADRWQIVDLNGYLIFNNGSDLPFTFRHEDNAVKPIYELREAGVARVGVIAAFNGFLLCGDVTEIQAAELATWMIGADPYGKVTGDIVNRIRYRIIWSEFGEPRKWAPIITATIPAQGQSAILAFPVSSETMDIGTKIAIIGAGVNGGTLGGQEYVEDGLPITSIMANSQSSLTGPEVSWSGVDSDGDLTYPLTVQITRFSDLSAISSYMDIQDDSSAIVAIRSLSDYLMVYRETSIFVGRYTATPESPFSFRRAYQGPNTVFYKHTLVDAGEYHLYASKFGFFQFDGLGEPKSAKALDDARDIFFDTADSQSFAARNPLTDEIWFFAGNNVLAYDTSNGTCSQIDAGYTAGAYTTAIGQAFLLAADGQVLKYGLDPSSGAAVYTRRDAVYAAVLCGGLVAFGDELSAKDVRTYLPQLHGRGDATRVTVTMRSIYDPSLEPDELFQETIEAISGEPSVLMLFRDVFFQDEITVISTNEIRLTGRTWEIAPARTRASHRISER